MKYISLPILGGGTLALFHTRVSVVFIPRMPDRCTVYDGSRPEGWVIHKPYEEVVKLVDQLAQM